LRIPCERDRQKERELGEPTTDRSVLCPLADLCSGETGIVQGTRWQTEHAELLASYGFFPGSVVTRVNSAPQGDPLIYRLEGRLVAVRRETAADIMVSRERL